MANPWRKAAVSDETWYEFLDWGYRHGVTGYNDRMTVEALLRAMLDRLKELEKAQGAS